MQDVIKKLTAEQALEVVRRLSGRGGKVQEAVLAEARDVLSEIDLDETADEVFFGRIPPSNDRSNLAMEADGARKRGTPQDISAGRCPTQARYTVKQGQYLAFIYYYTKIHGRSPSEARYAEFFQGIASRSTSDGPELGEAGVHREDTRSSQVTQAGAEPRANAGPDVSA